MSTLRLPLRDPFRIAGEPEGPSAQSTTTVIVERTCHDEVVGLGEATPYPYYGETTGTLAAVLPDLGAVVRVVDGARGTPDVVLDALDRASLHMDASLGGHGAAKCAIDVALHDAAAKRLEMPLFELLGTDPVTPPTDISLGLDEPERVSERALRLRHFPALKVKVGGVADLETLEAVREVYSGPIRVDANRGWRPEFAERMVPVLLRLGVELIEQPFGAREYAATAWLQQRSPLPIVADESLFTEDDLPPLVGAVAGVNVKLAKCGGIAAARRLISRARALGFKIMLGCVGETSVGIAAAAALGGLADWIDLDSSLLMERDPMVGLVLQDDCRWRLPDRPGHGVGWRDVAG
jgi:L-alanine-DL-glutamate epimerase-like enolase superfamily enzyme